MNKNLAICCFQLLFILQWNCSLFTCHLLNIMTDSELYLALAL